MKNNFVYKMKPTIVNILVLLLCFMSNAFAQSNKQDGGNNYIFYLHNKFPEEHALEEPHPDYGRSEYLEILGEFSSEGFILITEKRPANTDVKLYAKKVVSQIDSLLGLGIQPSKITVIGTSKGGYIAQYVSTYLANPNVNFIFIGCYQETDLQNFSDINYCGNILTIYEKSDYAGVSALNRKLTSTLTVNDFKEIELNTNLKHGFLFKPLKEWIIPCIYWAKQMYSEIDRYKENTIPFKVQLDTITLYDKSRSREVPIAMYQTTGKNNEPMKKLVIFNHGYGQNKGGDYLAYSYLTEYLAKKGYYVVSIQHELPTDSLIPLTGIPQIVRRPFWERGADNIFFVINQLKNLNPNIDFKHIALIGHSNGGDMVALFPEKYPNVINKIITLDNRRMALPRTDNPRVYSLRSSDQVADNGVLPTDEEVKQYKTTIINLKNTIHNQMDDTANETQRIEINNYILDFLTEID
jgi:predicted esterase